MRRVRDRRGGCEESVRDRRGGCEESEGQERRVRSGCTNDD